MNILDDCFNEGFAAAADITGTEAVLCRGESQISTSIIISPASQEYQDEAGKLTQAATIEFTVAKNVWSPQRGDKLIIAGEEYIVTGDGNISNGLASFFATKQSVQSVHDNEYFEV